MRIVSFLKRQARRVVLGAAVIGTLGLGAGQSFGEYTAPTVEPLLTATQFVTETKAAINPFMNQAIIWGLGVFAVLFGITLLMRLTKRGGR